MEEGGQKTVYSFLGGRIVLSKWEREGGDSRRSVTLLHAVELKWDLTRLRVKEKRGK